MHSIRHISRTLEQEVQYSVPENANPNGLFAIQLAQGEMYDLGNLAYIPHFILYDREAKIAIDVTSDVKPAPLLSKTRPAEILDNRSVGILEEYLTGTKRPEKSRSSFPQGIVAFTAEELELSMFDGVRQGMRKLYAASQARDEAVKALRTEAMILRQKYLPANN